MQKKYNFREGTLSLSSGNATGNVAATDPMGLGLAGWYVPGFPLDIRWQRHVGDGYLTEMECRVFDLELQAFDEVGMEFIGGLNVEQPELYKQHLIAFKAILSILSHANYRMKEVMAEKTAIARLPMFGEVNWASKSMLVDLTDRTLRNDPQGDDHE